MRTLFLLILWGLAVWGFAQDRAEEEPSLAAEESLETEEPLEADLPAETPPAKTFTQYVQNYFQWGKDLAIRKDFILSTLFFIWDPQTQGIGEELFTLHWSFLPYTSVGAGLGLSGFFGGFAFPQFAGFTLQGGFVLPVTRTIKVFGDLLLNMGYGAQKLFPAAGFALLFGYDLGCTIFLDKDSGIEITYKGLWTPQNRYFSSLGLGWLWNFW